MKTHLLDTNIVSRYLTLVPNFVTLLEKNIGIDNICISIVTKIELLNWLSSNNQISTKDRLFFKKSISHIPIIHINENISKLADNFMIKNINSKPADTLIGASAEYHKLILVTTNNKDFTNFKIEIIKIK